MISKECLFCGTILDDDSKSEYICPECESKMQLLKQLKMIDKATDKIRRMSERYFHKLKHEYKDERCLVAQKVIKDGFKFNSADEACVALQCEKERIKYIPNFKVGNYSVDFMFPDLKIVFEVDGELYHADSDKDFIRERCIMRVLGEEYEIVRLSTSHIPNFIMLNFSESLKHVIYQRKTDGHFRDTRFDCRYFEEYLHLHNYLKRHR